VAGDDELRWYDVHRFDGMGEVKLDLVRHFCRRDFDALCREYGLSLRGVHRYAVITSPTTCSAYRLAEVLPRYLHFPFSKVELISCSRYSAEDIMSFFDDKEIDAMVLINPDNPTGNYIPVEDLITLAEWTGQRGIAFVVDESFVDFVSMEDKDGAEAYTLLKDSLLRRFGRLYVVKSISKSYGVPGFRLGILASSDENTVTRIKKDVAIWNINSYGEFFMQILQKYQKDYAVALKKIKADRSQLVEGLKKIEGLKVYPSQANYVMCEITTDRYTGRSLAERLLSEDIFIKDLTAKINNGRQYVRLAVRDTADNEYLLSVLRKCM
jgi:histidinol-phosphate/aromatic aminotransferase/cobyric acid decarboxylase-like protein